MQIIPAIDLIDGKCVRLTQGDYSRKTIYNEDPLEVALQFESIGIKRLHLVDLDGARAGKVVNCTVLETIASQTNLIIDFGGGIKSTPDLESVFNAGADIATIGSLAIQQKELFFSWVKTYGAEKFLVGADVKEESIAINGWMETTNVNVIDFIQEQMSEGIKTVFCTDISKDGLLQGPAIDLYKKIKRHFPSLHLIASGGVSTIQDLEELKEIGCSAAIVGKAIYEGKIPMNALKSFIC